MAVSKFTPEIRGGLIERFAAGVSLEDACRAVGITEKTAKKWLARGRKDGVGPFADFARDVDEARAEAKARPEPMDAEELARVVSEAARKGSVAAMKLRQEMLLADRRTAEEPEEAPQDPLAGVDELAQRRAARA